MGLAASDKQSAFSLKDKADSCLLTALHYSSLIPPYFSSPQYSALNTPLYRSIPGTSPIISAT